MTRRLFAFFGCMFAAVAGAQQSLGPITTPRLNSTFYAGDQTYPTIQSAVTAACAVSAGARVTVPAGSTVADTIAAASACTGVILVDERVAPSVTYADVGGAWTPRLAPAALTTLRADTFSGADVSIQINACIAAVIAAGGGSCDARALGGAHTLSQEIDVNSSAAANASITTELILPVAFRWTFHGINSASACGIKVFNRGVITGAAEGAGGSDAILLTDSSDSSMLALFCTDNNPGGGGSYIRASGFSLQNPGATPFVDGEASVTHLFDESDFSYIFAENYSGDGWHIYGVCCGVRFDHIQGITGYGGGTNSGYPLVYGKSGISSNAITIEDSTFNRPQTGKPNILIQGGTGWTKSLSCLNCYMEGNGDTDTTTAMVLITGAATVTFIGGYANPEIVGGAPQATKPIFQNAGSALTVMNFGAAESLVGIVDTGSGTTRTIPTAPTNGPGPSNNLFTIPFYAGGTFFGGNQYVNNFWPLNMLGNPNYFGDLNLSSILSPTTPGSFPTATTGGTLPDATTYGYLVTATNSSGETLPAAEVTVTTGSSGSNANTVTVEWNHVIGAVTYKVYGRTPGSETLLQTLTNDNVLYWIDTGAATPGAAAAPTANTTSPCIYYKTSLVAYWCEDITPTGVWQLVNLHSGLALLNSTGGPTATTNINSDNGTGAVQINNLQHAGTGGLQVYAGGGSSTPALWGTIAQYGYQGAALLTGSPNVQNLFPTINWRVGSDTTSLDTLYWQDTGYSSGRGITDFANSLLRFQLIPNSTTLLNSGAGNNSVNINQTTGSGTNGLKVYSGGSTPVVESTLDSSGGLYLEQGGGFNMHLTGTPTANRTITLQDLSGTPALLGNFNCSSAPTGTPNSSTYLNGACAWATPPSAPVASVFGQTGAVPNLSGDVTTAGSSAATVVQVNGAAVPTSSAYVGTNASGQIIAASSPSGAVISVFGQTGAVPNLSGDVTTSGSSAATVKAINGHAITNVPVMTWTAAGSCGLTNANCETSAPLSIPYPITLVSFTAFAVTPPAGCTTLPTVTIYDSTTAAVVATVTFVNGTASYTGTISTAAIAANNSLFYRTGVAAAGCTTTPGSNVSLLATYTMQ